MNQVASYHDTVMRLCIRGAVVDQAHLVTRDVEELIVLGVQRADVQEAILRELAQGDQPLAVGILRLAHRGVGVSDLVVNVDLLQDRVDAVVVEGLDGLLDVPLRDH